MEGTQRGSLVVHGRLLSGKQTTVQLGGHPTSALVSDLKTLFGQSEGVPPQHMRLVHAGQVLEDSRTLASYSIASHDLVHIILASREDPFYPLSRLPSPDDGEVDTATAFTTPATGPIGTLNPPPTTELMKAAELKDSAQTEGGPGVATQPLARARAATRTSVARGQKRELGGARC